MVEILHKTKNLIVIYKPAGMPSQSDPSGDPDAMTVASRMLKESGEANDRLWLIHRLDRSVAGLLVFARNKQYAALLSELVKEHIFTKEYFAVVDGKPSGGVLDDLIIKAPGGSKAFIVDRERAGVKRAVLEYRTLGTVPTERGDKSLLYISLKTGRFHQIRAQLSFRHTPVTGDKKYGSRDRSDKGIALMAARLAFTLGKDSISVTRLPDLSAYPWRLFEENEYRNAFIKEAENDK